MSSIKKMVIKRRYFISITMKNGGKRYVSVTIEVMIDDKK